MPLSPGTLVGPYRIAGPLGSGGMGIVYRAQDERLQRPVAIKFLSPDALHDPRAFERFQQEARTASSLNHPNICTVHDIGEHAGEPFLVMELIEGQTLASRIEAGTIDVQQAMSLGGAIADALDAAHQREIVHRDVKPANVLITTRGDAKLLDFGLARLSAAADATATHTGTTAGTVSYMSPEQARNEALDHRTDLFSLGAVLYEMVTGVRPFRGASAALIFDAILHQPPRPPSQINPRVTPQLERIILRALEKDKTLRYQSAADLRAEIKGLLRSDPAVVPAVAPPRRAGPVLTVSLLAVVAAAGYAVWLTRPADENRPASLEQITESGDVFVASISNDGKYVAYAEAAADGLSLNVRQVQTKATVTIFPSGTYRYRGVSFSPDGAYLYVTTVGPALLLRVPALGGQPTTILEGIGSAVAVSPDGRNLAYARAKGADAELVVAAADGSQVRVVAFEKRPAFGAPAWSPDGNTIAWAEGNPSGTVGLTLVSPDGQRKEHLTIPGWRYVDSVVWRPDGRGFVLSAEEESREMTGRHQILEVTYPALEVTRLTNDLGDYHSLTGVPNIAVAAVQLGRRAGISVGTLDNPDTLRRVGTGGSDGSRGLTWTQDGRLVFVDTYTIGWIMNADGSALKPLLSDRRTANAPFPCGHAVGYTVAHGNSQSVFQIDPASGKPHHIMDTPQGQPACTVDGRSLFYADNETIKTVSTTTAGEPVLVQKDAHDPRVSPDGKLLAAHRRSDSTESFVIASIKDGALIRALPGPVGNFFVWEHTSEALIYSRGIGNVLNLWRAPIDGGPRTQITNFTSDVIYAFAVSADGRLAISRGETANDVVVLRR